MKTVTDTYTAASVRVDSREFYYDQKKQQYFSPITQGITSHIGRSFHAYAKRSTVLDGQVRFSVNTVASRVYLCGNGISDNEAMQIWQQQTLCTVHEKEEELPDHLNITVPPKPKITVIPVASREFYYDGQEKAYYTPALGRRSANVHRALSAYALRNNVFAQVRFAASGARKCVYLLGDDITNDEAMQLWHEKTECVVHGKDESRLKEEIQSAILPGERKRRMVPGKQGINKRSSHTKDEGGLQQVHIEPLVQLQSEVAPVPPKAIPLPDGFLQNTTTVSYSLPEMPNPFERSAVPVVKPVEYSFPHTSRGSFSYEPQTTVPLPGISSGPAPMPEPSQPFTPGDTAFLTTSQDNMNGLDTSNIDMTGEYPIWSPEMFAYELQGNGSCNGQVPFEERGAQEQAQNTTLQYRDFEDWLFPFEEAALLEANKSTTIDPVNLAQHREEEVSPTRWTERVRALSPERSADSWREKVSSSQSPASQGFTFNGFD